MKWRKLNRSIHRDLGYIFFGMTIIYSVSGIVLNHKQQGGDASIVTRSESFSYPSVSRDNIDKDYIIQMLESFGEEESEFKNFYFPSDQNLMIYLKQGHINYDLNTETGNLIKIKRRAILYDFNFLHYNKPKQLWTWVSDIYAASLGLMAITGLFVLKGKNGIKRRGAILASFGILVPIGFLIFYLWTR